MMESAIWLLLASNLCILPYFPFLLATALGAIFARRPKFPEGEPRSRFLIVIPAHDEESGIGTTVASCRRADYPESLFHVLVIADNCADRTAAVAAQAGARVVERFDAERKSKGYALEYLIDRLIGSGEFDDLDALVIVDADTTVDPDLLRWFDADLRAGRDWIQCYYTVANSHQSWRTRLMTYAFSLFNGVLLYGKTAIGSSAGLRGNGMCFSTRGLRRHHWACHGLVEDMEFSWTLRLEGEKIAFQPSTRVYGAMLESGGAAAASQRRRWEFGRSEVRRRYLSPLLRSRRIRWFEKLVSLCEITMPTMGVLLSAYMILAFLDLLAFAAGAPSQTPVQWILLTCAAVMTGSLALYAVSPFLAMRLPWSYVTSLTLFPFYLGWKFLVSLSGRPKGWVRTPRETPVDSRG